MWRYKIRIIPSLVAMKLAKGTRRRDQLILLPNFEQSVASYQRRCVGQHAFLLLHSVGCSYDDRYCSESRLDTVHVDIMVSMSPKPKYRGPI